MMKKLHKVTGTQNDTYVIDLSEIRAIVVVPVMTTVAEVGLPAKIILAENQVIWTTASVATNYMDAWEAMYGK